MPELTHLNRCRYSGARDRQRNCAAAYLAMVGAIVLASCGSASMDSDPNNAAPPAEDSPGTIPAPKVGSTPMVTSDGASSPPTTSAPTIVTPATSIKPCDQPAPFNAEYSVVGTGGETVGAGELTQDGPMSLSGRIAFADGTTVDNVPVIGDAAANDAGGLLVVGGPTRELLWFTPDRGATWDDGASLPPPDMPEGFDFGWWSYGVPAVGGDDAFLVPAVWNQTPPDRSVIQAMPYLAVVGPSGDLLTLTRLDTNPIDDITLQMVTVGDYVLVADGSGRLSLFTETGRYLIDDTDLTDGQPVSDVRPVAPNAVELTLLGPDKTETRLSLCIP